MEDEKRYGRAPLMDEVERQRERNEEMRRTLNELERQQRPSKEVWSTKPTSAGSRSQPSTPPQSAGNKGK